MNNNMNNNNNTLTKSLFNNASEDEIKYRLQLLKYLDNKYYENNEYLFFNMLEYTKFIKEKNSIAYTDRQRIIYLNAPTSLLGNENWKWEFVFAHECMHQIYDTFAVGDLIIKELGKDKYDHYLLNIASDCVINETLNRRYKKKMPDDLITARYIKNKYNINYNIMEDTQYSLYLKIFEAKDKHEEMKNDEILNKNISIHDKSEQPGQDGQGNQTGQGNQPSQPGQGNQSGQDGQSNINSKNKHDSYSNEEFGEYKELLDYYDSEPEIPLKELIEKTKNTLTGPIGEFIENIKKIPGQIKKTKYGISIKVDRGGKSDYIKELFNKTKIILSNKIQSIRKQYKSTYSRVNRRDPLSSGGIIKKGKKIEQDKINLDITFYVDISGSMGDPVVSSIFNNLYNNAKSITDIYTKTYDDVLNNVIFNYYAFNENITLIKNKNIPHSNGGNVSLDILIKYIKEYTKTSLINVIITDAGFDIDNNKIIAEMNNIDGFLIIITNKKWSGFDTIDKESNGKITAIYTQTY